MKGFERPWHNGVLYNDDARIAGPLIAALNHNADVTVGDNLPYSGYDLFGNTIETHAMPQGRPNILLEIRQDLIDTHHGAAKWAGIIADALAPVRQTEVGHPAVFVTDEARRLLGVVPLLSLLRAPDVATLATLMQPAPAVLMALAPLAGAPAHSGWASASALPVVESGDRLLGVMTHDAMTRALRRHQVPEPSESHADIGLAGLMARACWQTVVGLVAVCLPLMPRVPPVWPEPRGDDER